MSKPIRFPVRLVLYGSIAAYLAGDLLIFHGPLRQKLELANPQAEGKESGGVVAKVAGHPISVSQLDRAVSESLWLTGRTTGDLSPAGLKAARTAALEDLIDRQILRLQSKALASQLEATPGEIDERFRRLLGRFESRESMEAAMKSQGIGSETSLRDRIASQIRQEKYIELRITPRIGSSGEEVGKWLEANKDSVSLPERIEVRHIFIPTLDHPPEEAKQKLETALAELTENKKDFPTLASEISEDPATKDKGGNLGWMSRDRLPADFAAPVFLMETHKPALVRTKLGWHLVEITARKPVEPRTLDQAKPGIVAALETVKRKQAITDLRSSLRNAGSAKIEVFQNMPD